MFGKKPELKEAQYFPTPTIVNAIYNDPDYALEILKDQIGFIDENSQNNFVQRILNHRLFFVSGGILAGTNEIQKNIIAQRGLGFPK